MVCNQDISIFNSCRDDTGSITAITKYKINDCLDIEKPCEFFCGDKTYELIDENTNLIIQANLKDTLNSQLTYECEIGEDEIMYEFEVKRIPDSEFGANAPNPFSWYWDYNVCSCPSCYYLNYSLLLSSDLFTNFNDWVVRLTWNLNYLYSGDRQGNVCPNAIKELTGNFTSEGNYRIKIILDKAIYLSCYGQDCDTPWAFCYAYKYSLSQCIIKTKIRVKKVNNPNLPFSISLREVCDGTPVPTNDSTLMPFPIPPIGNSISILSIPAVGATPEIAAQNLISAYKSLSSLHNAYISPGDDDNVITLETPCDGMSCNCNNPDLWFYWYASTFVTMTIENVNYQTDCTTRSAPLTPEHTIIHNPFCCPTPPECEYPKIFLIDECCNKIGDLEIIYPNSILWKGMGTIFNPKLSIQSYEIDPSQIPLDVFGFSIEIGNKKFFNGLYKKVKCEGVVLSVGIKPGCYLQNNKEYIGIPSNYCSTDGTWHEFNQQMLVEGDIKLINSNKDNNIVREEWRLITAPLDKYLLEKFSNILSSKQVKINQNTFNVINGSASRIEGTLNYTLDLQLEKFIYSNQKNCNNC